jgi:hypothetical protein
MTPSKNLFPRPGYRARSIFVRLASGHATPRAVTTVK